MNNEIKDRIYEETNPEIKSKYTFEKLFLLQRMLIKNILFKILSDWQRLNNTVLNVEKGLGKQTPTTTICEFLN